MKRRSLRKALLEAVKLGKVDEAEKILKMGTSPNCEGGALRRTSIHMAASPTRLSQSDLSFFGLRSLIALDNAGLSVDIENLEKTSVNAEAVEAFSIWKNKKTLNERLPCRSRNEKRRKI